MSGFQPRTAIGATADPLVSNRVMLNPLFPEGAVELESLTNRARKTIMARGLAGIIPVQSTSFYLPPAGSVNLSGIGSNVSGQFLRFEIGKIDNLVKIDSVKLTLTIANNSGVSQYIAPSPCIMDRVDISFNSASSDPCWTDFGQNVLGYHMAMLSFMDRDEARQILKQEGFIKGSNGGEDLQVITSPAANVLQIASYSPLYPDGLIPNGQTVDISLWILGSPITSKGFLLGMLEGSQKCTINFTFKSGGQWISNAGAISVQKAVLAFEGKSTNPEIYSSILSEMRLPGRGITLPYYRPTQMSFPTDFTANQKQSQTLTQFVGGFAFLSFYASQRNPATSNAPQNDVSSSEYFQGILPQIATFNLGAGTSTLTAGSLGELQTFDNITILKDSVATVNTPDLTSEQLNTLAFSATDNKSYLIPIYPSRYFYPFSTDLYEDCVKGNVFKNGFVRLTANATISFTPRNNLLNSSLYVFGAKCATLQYSPESGLTVVH